MTERDELNALRRHSVFSQTATVIVDKQVLVKWYLFSIFLSIAVSATVTVLVAIFDTWVRIIVLFAITVCIPLAWDPVVLVALWVLKACERIEQLEPWWTRLRHHFAGVRRHMHERLAIRMQVEHTIPYDLEAQLHRRAPVVAEPCGDKNSASVWNTHTTASLAASHASHEASRSSLEL